MMRRDRCYVEVVEFDWGQPDSVQVIASLFSVSPDFLIAADCLYIDEVELCPHPMHSKCRMH